MNTPFKRAQEQGELLLQLTRTYASDKTALFNALQRVPAYTSRGHGRGQDGALVGRMIARKARGSVSVVYKRPERSKYTPHFGNKQQVKAGV